MRLKNLRWVTLGLALASPAMAHLGSPDVFYDGGAGPYRLFVTVRVPQTIPGLSEVQVRAPSGVRKIRVTELLLTGEGSQYAPAGQLAEASEADPQFFTCGVWLMVSGVFQLRLQVDGAQGRGEMVVPVPATALGTLSMQRSLEILLGALLLLLVAGVVSIVGALFGEAMVEPGRTPGPETRRRTRLAMAVTAMTVLGVLYVGNRWWNLMARASANTIYKPPRLQARLAPDARLILRATESEWLEQVKVHPLIPDHNHLMHLFLVRQPGMDQFWHLHPEQGSAGVFLANLPSMPAGHYKLFADVVHESGFPETMLADVDLPEVVGKPVAGDDSGTAASPFLPAGPDSRTFALPGGSRMAWLRDSGPLEASVPVYFRFRVEDNDGKPAEDLEPYMGMAGHAEFIRSDATVFAHVHPAGSISMADLELAQASLLGSSDSGMGMRVGHPMAPAALSPEVAFPYGFPRSGRYRIFVQVKRHGRILTAVFDASVN